MTKDEALKLALEALVDFGWHIENCPQFPTWAEPENHPSCTCGYDTAITAIRQALEQPECTDCNGMGFVDGVGERCQKCAGEGVEQTEQSTKCVEPVAWGFQNTAITGSNRWMYLRETIPTNDQYRGVLWTPLYTAPPKQEFVCSTGLCHYKHWVGLTDEEASQIENEYTAYRQIPEGSVRDFTRAIEAKLKEKNK